MLAEIKTGVLLTVISLWLLIYARNYTSSEQCRVEAWEQGDRVEPKPYQCNKGYFQRKNELLRWQQQYKDSISHINLKTLNRK